MGVTVFKSWPLTYASCFGLYFLINLNIVFVLLIATELFFSIELSILPSRHLLRVVTAKLDRFTADSWAVFPCVMQLWILNFIRYCFIQISIMKYFWNSVQLIAVLTTLKIFIQSKRFTGSLHFSPFIFRIKLIRSKHNQWIWSRLCFLSFIAKAEEHLHLMQHHPAQPP